MAKGNVTWKDVKESILTFSKVDGGTGDIKLPPELKLSEMYGVSRSSVREALAQLIQEGVVYRVHGKGSFLRTTLTKLNLDITKLYSVVDAIKRTQKKPRIELKDKKLITANEEVASKLNIQVGESCLYVERIIFADDEMAVLNRYYFNINPIKDATDEELEGSIFNYLNNVGSGISYARSKIRASVLTQLQYPELRDSISSFLLLEETYYNKKGDVICATYDYYANSEFDFEVIRRGLLSK